MSAISSTHSMVMSVESMSIDISRTRSRRWPVGTNAKSRCSSAQKVAVLAHLLAPSSRNAWVPPPGTPTMREAPVRRASSLSVGVGISGAWITSEKIRESEAEVLTVSISVSQICKNAFSAPCAGERSTPLFRLGSARLSDRLRRRASFAIDEHKVDFGCLEIDARHLDRDAIGEAKALSGSLAVHRVTYRVEVKVIVAELGDVHQPVDVEAVERDEQSEMRDTAHRAGENFSDLVLHEIALEPVLDISRRIVGAALGERAMHSQLGPRRAGRTIALAGETRLDAAVDQQVR